MSCEFTANELHAVAALLEARYGAPVPIECGEAELASHGTSPLAAPVVYWEARGAQFAVCRLAQGRYRGEFFEGGEARAGSGHRDFDDLDDCVTALLRLQSDRERERAGAVSGATAATLSDEEYHGPIVV